MTTFLKFRESVLAKAFGRTRGAKAMKASRKAASGQKEFALPPGAKKHPRPLLPQGNGGKRHSEGGAQG